METQEFIKPFIEVVVKTQDSWAETLQLITEH
jgi:hypothetical protein